MFDELENDSGFDVSTVTRQDSGNQSNNQGSEYRERPQESNQNSYQGNQGGNQRGGQGGYQGGNQGGYQGGNRGGFQRKPQEDIPQDPYLPVIVYVEQDFPEEVKESLISIASKLIGKGYTIRIYGTDKPFVEKLQRLSTSKVELYLPWRNFNELDSKRTWNTATSKEVARLNFPGWEKIPDSVKGILAGQIRLLLGDRNNSPAKCLITWSRDGASKAAEVSKETGRSGFLIKTAATYAFPVINVQKPSSETIIEKSFGL